MQIRPLEIKDLETIQIDDSLKNVLRSYIEVRGTTHARIGEIDDKPVFACGICPFWPGVAEVWIRVFDETHAIGIIRAGKELLRDLCKDFGLHRLQATIREDDKKTLKFDQHMGFFIERDIPEYYSDKCNALILRYRNA